MKRTTNRRAGRIASLIVCAVMILTMVTPVFATAPVIKKVKYEGSGKVEVDFRTDVQYKNAKVTVKDSSGKSYSAKITDKDDDDLEFKVSSIKAGKKYKFTISGIRKKGTSAYGKVSGSFSVPAASTKEITKTKAKSIALDNAVSKFKITRSTAKSFEIEKDTYRGKKVWEVEFKAKKNGKWYEYEYQIQRSDGKILFKEEERD